ncbi:unnamed protein product [Acanthoscelides obtectus]|uniref:Uncharacterized protein n=1 Tax=Acanthoscelides obtectus TaxID=200917 RepID=A0A9P0M0G8_ACAOB|nr:unnamed protein product [Acanthoscelides obtectus]CAK1628193.1 hypothetical protein AOBTE_LOCUS5067 [Acanthoscelides obtectus]
MQTSNAFLPMVGYNKKCELLPVLSSTCAIAPGKASAARPALPLPSYHQHQEPIQSVGRKRRWFWHWYDTATIGGLRQGPIVYLQRLDSSRDIPRPTLKLPSLPCLAPSHSKTCFDCSGGDNQR